MSSDRIKAKRKRWYYRHRERILEYQKQNHLKNKAEHNRKSLAYYQKTKEATKEQRAELLRQWRKENPDKVAEQRKRAREYQRKYSIEHRTTLIAQAARRQQLINCNPEVKKQIRAKLNAWARSRYHKDIQLTRSKSLAKNQRRKYPYIAGKHTIQQWMARVEYFGWRCRYCNCVLNRKTLTKDHVIPVALGGTDFASNLVPACKPCNCSKGAKKQFQ